MNNPLIGKILRFEDADDSFFVSRFVAPLGNDYWLLERLCPHGTPTGVMHVMRLDQLLRETGADIFGDWQAFADWLAQIMADDDEESGPEAASNPSDHWRH